MLPVNDIVRIALREFDGPTPELAAYTDNITKLVAKPDEIPAFSSSSKPLSLVRFRCLLQDTGYPAEVYLPSDEGDANGVEGSCPRQVDWSKLQERWVGWAVEVPGEQPWAKEQYASTQGDLAGDLAALSVSGSKDTTLPPVIKDKYPLTALGATNYTGALLKVYDADVSFRPASAYDVIGIVSAAPVPTPYDEGDGDENDDDSNVPLVPAIHVLLPPTPAFPSSAAAAATPADTESTRAALIEHLSRAFSPPDATAAELLLCALIATPASRAGGTPDGEPIGTLALNLMRPSSTATSLATTLSALLPTLVPLSLSLPLLHAAHFHPISADGTSLAPGLLQLAPGTTLLVNEDALGDGGALADRAVRNVHALRDVLVTQRLQYAYPYMDALRMDTAVRGVLESEAASLLPADVRVPVLGAVAEHAPALADADATRFRSFIAYAGGATRAKRVGIPAPVAEAVQESFVRDRQATNGAPSDAAEERLTRRMKIARVLALSQGTAGDEAELTAGVWERAVALDVEVERRMAEREAKRREGKIGAPAEEVTGAAMNGAAVNREADDDELEVEKPVASA